MRASDYEIFRIFPDYFAAIEYGQDPDSGAWEEGHERLDATLPFESPPERLVDSALLSLIHPLGVVQTREWKMQFSIWSRPA